MKRGAKVCLLGFAGILATALMTFLLMHVALVAVTPPPTTRHHPRPVVGHARALSSTRTKLRWVHPWGYRRSVATDMVGGPMEHPAAVDAIEQATASAAAKRVHVVVRSAAPAGVSPPTNTGPENVDCGVDRSFAPQCVGVSPKSWQLYRSVQAVGRMTIDSNDCSGVLLGDASEAFFLTSARCLPWEGMVEHASIEFTNCIGSQVFTSSSLHHLNRQLDFVVLKLSTQGFNVAGHYGFLRLRANGPAEEEVVFVPHYTDCYDKRITIINDEGLVEVRQFDGTTHDACATTDDISPTRVQFTAARLDASARGAPVVSLSHYEVVAVHLCGGCDTRGSNTALSTKHIIDDLNATGRLIPAFLAKN